MLLRGAENAQQTTEFRQLLSEYADRANFIPTRFLRFNSLQ